MLGFPSLGQLRYQKEDQVVEIAGTRVSTVEMPCFRISTSLEPPKFLRYQSNCKEVTGRLASLASHSFGTGRSIRSVSGQVHCRIQAQRSHMPNRTRLLSTYSH